MEIKRSSRRALLTLGLGMALVVSLLAGVASAGKTPTTTTTTTPPSPASVTWTGNGSVVTGGVRTLKTVICDASSTPYLLWVLSGSKATSASINIPGQSTTSMGKPQVDKQGYSTFKYTWSPGTAINLDTLYNTVTATYNDAKNKATFTVSHGCLGSGGGGTTTTTSTTSTSTTSTSTTSTSTTTSSTTTSTTTTSTTAPARLTVHLIGDFEYNVPPTPSVWANLGSVAGTNATMKVCETGTTTGCVDFAAGAAPGSTGTITLSGANKALDVTMTDDFSCQAIYLFSSDVPASAFQSTTPLESGYGSLTTSTTFSNGGDAWFATDCAT